MHNIHTFQILWDSPVSNVLACLNFCWENMMYLFKYIILALGRSSCIRQNQDTIKKRLTGETTHPQILNGLWQKTSATKFKVKGLHESCRPPVLLQTPSCWRPDAPSRSLDGVQPWLRGRHDYWGCCNCWQQDRDFSLPPNEEMKGKKEEMGWNEKWMTTTETEQETVRRIKEISCLCLLCFWALSLVIPQWYINSPNCCYLSHGLLRKGRCGNRHWPCAHSCGLGIQPTLSDPQPVVG